MLHTQPVSFEPFSYNNWGVNPSGQPGLAVIPGASNAEGSWASVASSSDITQDVVGFTVLVRNGATSTQVKSHLLDIGVDPAGGTSYTEVISNIVCGTSGNIVNQPGHAFTFPLNIKAGSSVAVRVQGNNATAGQVTIAIKFHGQSSRPEFLPKGQFSETIGTITASSAGVAFTPGNATDGSWTSLGTTSKPMWWWQIGYQISTGTITNEQTYIDLAYGDGSNKHIIKRIMHIGSTTELIGDFFSENLNMFSSFCPVPAGATMYIRGRCVNAPDANYNAVAIGVG